MIAYVKFRKLQKRPGALKTIFYLVQYNPLLKLTSRKFSSQQLHSRARQQKKFTRIMFHRGRNKRDSQRPLTLKNALNFLVAFKPLFHGRFKGLRKQFQSKRLVMLRTDVYVTTDLYQAKQQDKPRIVRRYKMHMLLLVNADGCGGELLYERGGDARRLA